MNWSEALPNLLIGLREGLEGGLVVTILLAAVRKTAVGDRRARTAPIWLGVAGALSLSLSAVVLLTVATDALSSRAREIVAGVLSLMAVVLVTVMIFWMRRTARTLSGEITGKVAAAAAVGSGALVLTAFLAVGREGLETMLFLWAAARAAGESTAPIVGATIGVVIAVVLCTLLYRRAIKFNLGVFFTRTAVLLVIIAAGVLAYGFGDLQSAGVLPGNSWIAWDLSAHVDSGSWWAVLISGVTNLTVRMSVLQVVAWVVYLVVVLAAFWSGGHHAAPAANPERATTPEREPVAASVGRRNPMLLGSALVVVPLLVALVGYVVLPHSGGATTAVTVSDTSCAPGWSGAAGSRTFEVRSSASHPAEINLVDSSGAIVGEIETLGPGTTASLTATMRPGSYTFHCLLAGGGTLASAAVTVTGPAVGPANDAVIPVTQAELTPPAAAYTRYATARAAALARQVAALRADVDSGNLTKARHDWLPAQLTWGLMGAAYGSFGDLGEAIDGLADGLPGGVHDAGFRGLHRLEYGLWHAQSAKQLRPVVAGLVADVAKLRRKLPDLTLDPTDLPVRTHEILEDTLRDRLSGMADYGSGTEYAQAVADVRATRVTLTLLEPLIEKRRAGLTTRIRHQLDTLDAALDTARSGHGWPPLADVPLLKRQAVNAALGQALESLADIPTLLELRAIA